jgi:hypothetical protein
VPSSVYLRAEIIMVNIDRIRVPWVGGIGGAGLSTFYFLDGVAALPAVKTFFDTVANIVPSGISWSFPGTGDTIDSDNGKIVGTWVGTGQALVQSTVAGPFAAPAGLLVTWITSGLVNGHRVKGRTFIVPASNSSYDASGTVNDAILATLQGQAGVLLSSTVGNMQVWSRPHAATPQWTDVQGRTHPATAARIGQAVTVVDAVVKDKAVVLRSRRD